MSLKIKNRALIKFEGRIGGKNFESSKPFQGGTSRKVFPLIIGSNSFIGAGKDFITGKSYKGFEEQLIGMKKGEMRIIEVIFPQDYHESNFAGNVAFFKVELEDFS